MQALLLAGFESHLSKSVSCLQQHIEDLKHFGFIPYVVLSELTAEHYLLNCSDLELCEIIFDTSGLHSTWQSNLWAGSFALTNHCAVMAHCCPQTTIKLWNQLRHSLHTRGITETTDFVYLPQIDPESGPNLAPMMFTMQGILKLRKLDAFSGFSAQGFSGHSYTVEGPEETVL